MTAMKPWCWQAAQDAKGPDWLLLAKATPSSEQALAQAAAAASIDGYTAFANSAEYCPTHQQTCSFHTFIDTTNAEAYQANLSAKEPRNIWIYNLIQIHRDQVMLEAGYGGRGETYNQAETEFLLRLFNTPGITLEAWQVFAGGNGYDHNLIQEGAGVDSFLAYLTPP
jgi:hypothetical protein